MIYNKEIRQIEGWRSKGFDESTQVIFETLNLLIKEINILSKAIDRLEKENNV